MQIYDLMEKEIREAFSASLVSAIEETYGCALINMKMPLLTAIYQLAKFKEAKQ